MTAADFHFERVPRNWRGGPGLTLTLARGGQGILSLSAFEALGRPEAVHLLFDPGKQVLGLRPVARSEPDAFGINPSSRTFSIRGLCHRYGLTFERSQRYAAERHAELLIVDLREPPLKVF